MAFYDQLLTDWGFTGEDYRVGMGSDKTHSYMKSKGATFWVSMNDRNERTIGFKPYLSKFSISYNPKLNELESVFNGTKMITPIVATIDYKITLQIPSTSVNESRANKRRLELLKTFVDPSMSSGNPLAGTGELSYGEIRHLILFSNLINNGNVAPGEDFDEIEIGSSQQNLRMYACQGVMQEVSYSIETGDGYFEHDGKLFPKTYSCDITFIAFNQHKNIPNLNIGESRYLTDGFYNAMGQKNPPSLKLSRGWPFGISVDREDKKVPLKASSVDLQNLTVHYSLLAANNLYSSDEYVYHKKGGIYIFPTSLDEDFNSDENDLEGFEGIGLYFKPVINSYSYNRKVGSSDTFNTQTQSTFLALPAVAADVSLVFDVPSENLTEAVSNHAKVQELIKFLAPRVELDGSTFIEKKSQTFIKILHSNIIFNESQFTDSKDPFAVNAGMADIKDLPKTYQYSSYLVAAKPFFLKNIVYDPDINEGYFEYKKMLFPKKFKLSLSLTENYDSDQRQIVYTLRRNRTVQQEEE